MLVTKGPQGETIAMRVHEVKDKTVVVDFNNPLAGKTLNFDVKVTDINQPGDEMLPLISLASTRAMRTISLSTVAPSQREGSGFMAPKFFYGYVILALCFINMVVMRGVNGSFSVYYLALLENFGWSHSDGASIASVNFLVYALAAPFVGFAFDRFGPRVLMPLGGALVGVGLLLSGFGNSLWQSVLFLRLDHRLGSRGARIRRPQRADLLLVCAPPRHRHRHRQHGPRIGRA